MCKTFDKVSTPNVASLSYFHTSYLADLVFRDCASSVEGKEVFTSSSVIATAVLKTIETLGVSYVKLSEQYRKKLESESKNLNFPYRSETVSIFK